jgi:hypothetical protein
MGPIIWHWEKIASINGHSFFEFVTKFGYAIGLDAYGVESNCFKDQETLGLDTKGHGRGEPF